MKHLPMCFLLGTLLTSFMFFSCQPKDTCQLNQIKIGEIVDNTPQLTYGDMPRLRRAMQLAFLPTMQIDTMFLYSDTDDTGTQQIFFTAAGQETDSTFVSLILLTRQVNGISLISGPISDVPNPEPVWCYSLACPKCILLGFSCHCGTDGTLGEGCSKDVISVPGGTNRPVDLLEIIVPYLIVP